MIVPEKLQGTVLEKLHTAHPGVIRMKFIARYMYGAQDCQTVNVYIIIVEFADFIDLPLVTDNWSSTVAHPETGR